MKKNLLKLILIFVSNIGFTQNELTKIQINNPNKQYELIGKLGEKLGSTHTVYGIIIDGSSKGYESGPNLLVQIINEKSNQIPIQIPVSPYFGTFGIEPLPNLEIGYTYRLRVYETGEFVGVPNDAYKEANIALQTSSFYFRNELIVISGEKIKPIEYSPLNFVGCNALLSGIARNENDTAIIVSSDWKLKLNGCAKWKKSEIGKSAEVLGEIQKTNSKNIFVVNDCSQRLILLEDQIGKSVKLRGRAINLNEDWWFNYRGTDISIEKVEELKTWSGKDHFRPMEISGTLEECDVNDKQNTNYIIRNAKWTPIENLLIPELDFQK